MSCTWPARALEPIRQPIVVCDFSAVKVGTVDAGALRSREEGPLRLTFRDLDAKAGKARMTFGDGASGDEFAALTVEADAISYLVERAGVFKLIVTTATKATAEGWPAMLSQHSAGAGELTLRTAAGFCRMRAP